MRMLFPEWRDEQQKVKYPFSDAATLTNGDVTIPTELFIDGRLYPIGAGDRVFISKIERNSNTITLTLSDGATELATASYSVSAPPSNGELAFEDIYGRPAGVLVSAPDDLQLFGAIGQGEHIFTVDQTELVPAVLVPMPDAGVRGIVTEDGGLIAGDVWLVGEDGVVLRSEQGRVRIDVVGDPFAKRDLCEEEQEAEEGEAPPILAPFCPIRTINGYGPDAYGNFEMRVGGNQVQAPIMRIDPEPDANSLRIKLVGQRRFRGV